MPELRSFSLTPWLVTGRAHVDVHEVVPRLGRASRLREQVEREHLTTNSDSAVHDHGG